MTPQEIANLHANQALATVDVAADRYQEAYKAFKEAGLEPKAPEAMNPDQHLLREDVIAARWDLTDSIAALIHDRYGLLARVDIL